MRGSVSSYGTKTEGRRWRYQYDLPLDPDTGERRRVTKRGFTTKREASRALREALGRVDAGFAAVSASTTLSAYLRSWVEGIRVKPTTLADYRQSIRCYVTPRIGSVRLGALTPELLDALYRGLESNGRRLGSCRTDGHRCSVEGCRPDLHAGLAAKSVRNVHGMLHKALQDAAERGHVLRNVAALANPPTAKQSRSRQAREACWTVVEMRRFLEHVRGDRLYALWHLVSTTGLRRGEVLGLRWVDLDLDAGTLRVAQTVTIADNELVWSDDGKTVSSERTISIDPETIEVLRFHRRRQDVERREASSAWTDSGLVFTREDGQAMNPKRLSQQFTATARAADLESIGVHGLRHTYATAALRAGVQVHVLSPRLGHADIATTLTIYAHVLEKDDAEAAEIAAVAILGR